MKLEFFFDCSSPWTYLAFHNVQPMAEELGLEIDWQPILVGGIFNTVNQSVYEQRAKPNKAKARYHKRDMMEWAEVADLKIKFPPAIFPINSVKAMRACIALKPQGLLVPFATRIFEAYWAEDRDIASDDVIRDCLAAVGADADAVMAAIQTPEIKDQLKANTQTVIDRGGFGSPTMFLGDRMYFGNDRLPLIRARIEQNVK
jgi:2-hydroxychromene-2-carboxylate isomerase